MGYSQGKMIKPEELHNTQNIFDNKDSLLTSNVNNITKKINLPFKENFKIISKTIKKNVECIIIEFSTGENKQIDCEISLNRINFEEAYEMDLIFESIIKVFGNIEINLPNIIYLNIENSRINIFLKLKSIEEIILITSKFISLIKNFNKIIKFTNDIDFKVHKKPEIQSNYSPLSSNSYVNQFNTKQKRNSNEIASNENLNKSVKSTILTNKEITQNEIQENITADDNKNRNEQNNIFITSELIQKESFESFKQDNFLTDKDSLKIDTKYINKDSKEKDKSIKENNPFNEYEYKKYNLNRSFKNNLNLNTSELTEAKNDNIITNYENICKKASNNSIIQKNINCAETKGGRLTIHTEIEDFIKNDFLDDINKNTSKELNSTNYKDNENFINKKVEEIEFNSLQTNNDFIRDNIFYHKKNESQEKAMCEFTNEEKENNHHLKQTEESFYEKNNMSKKQKEEELEKLIAELQSNHNKNNSGNYLLNENFFNNNIEDNNNQYFDEKIQIINENDNKNIEITSNYIIENSQKNLQNLIENNFNLKINNKNKVDAGINEISLTGNEFKNHLNQSHNNRFEEANENKFENFDKNKTSTNNIHQNKEFGYSDKINGIESKTSKYNNTYTKNSSDNVSKSNFNSNDMNNFNNRNIKYNNKYMNKFKFNQSSNNSSFNSIQNNMPIYDNNMNKNANYNLMINSTNNFDNMGINMQRTRNYFINNVLNFNPNSNNNFVNSDISKNPNYNNFKSTQNNSNNYNNILNPNLINHNMLLIMKKFNQNSINNPIINTNNNYAFNNFGINNNNSYANDYINSFNNNYLDNNNNENHSVNNYGNTNNIEKNTIGKNDFCQSKINNINLNQFNYIPTTNNNLSSVNYNPENEKGLKEKIDYLQNIVKIIPKDEGFLEGFYFKNNDYISDDDFISFYFIGNLNILNKKRFSSGTDLELKKEHSVSSIISNYFKENFNLKLTHLIRNPSESKMITRLVFQNTNETNILLNQTDGLEHIRIEINNCSFILIRIKSLIFKFHPEELFLDLQLKIRYEVINFDERDFVNFLEKNLQINFFEISFITEGECVITFFEKEKLKNFIKIFNEKPFHQIKRPLRKVKIETLLLNEPFPIYGNQMNIIYEEDFEIKEISERPPKSIKIISGDYTPMLKKLIFNRNIWNSYKVEKNNYELINVENFYNEIISNDLENIKSIYSLSLEENCFKDDKISKEVYKKDKIIFTVLDYFKTIDIDKKKFNNNNIKEREENKQNIEEDNESNDKDLRSSIKANNYENNNYKNHNHSKYYNNKKKIIKDEFDSDYDYSKNSNSESSFSLKNIEDSDLDLSESISNSPPEFEEKKIYKKRGRKPKNYNFNNNENNNYNINKDSNINNIFCIDKNNFYGKKFINSNKRNYNHSRYSINNLQLETSIDPNKPNILDELIEDNLNDQEKHLLEMLEKDVEEKIFKNNSNNYENFIPRKRGRKPKSLNAINGSIKQNNNLDELSEKNYIFNKSYKNSNKILLRNRKSDKKYFKDSDQSFNEYDYNDEISEKGYNFKNSIDLNKKNFGKNLFNQINKREYFEIEKVPKKFTDKNTINCVSNTLNKRNDSILNNNKQETSLICFLKYRKAVSKYI